MLDMSSEMMGKPAHKLSALWIQIYNFTCVNGAKTPRRSRKKVRLVP